MFQSSPVTKDGRYFFALALRMRLVTFQSSPVTKDGRYDSTRPRMIRNRRFNPRPSLRTGATVQNLALAAEALFQSSPVTKDGRYINFVASRN